MVAGLKHFSVVALLAGAAQGETVFCRSMDRVASMDPAEASALYASRAVRLVYETLYEYDYVARPYKLIPGLAEAMPEVQSNGLVYVFRIHPLARFQPDPCFGSDASGQPRGRPVTAADVVFSLKRLADRKVASPGAWLVEDAIAGMRAFAEKSAGAGATDYGAPVAGLQALDDRTVRIELTRPMNVFAYYLTIAYSSVVPREAVTCYGSDFGSHAVGSGSYRLTGWQRNHQMTFTRDPAWRGWQTGPAAADPAGGEVPFDRVDYRVIDDVSTQWLCFLTGELDFLGEITRDNWDVVIDGSGGLSAPLRERGITVSAMPTLEVAYIGINMDDPVVGRNRALRQARSRTSTSR